MRTSTVSPKSGHKLNSCFIYLHRFLMCAKKEYLYSQMCLEEAEDYYECKTRKKDVSSSRSTLET